MSDALKILSIGLSRRSLLRKFAFTAGGAGMIAAALSGNRVAAAQVGVAQKALGEQIASKSAECADPDNRVAAAKMTQKAVGYQETPKGAQRCDNCSQFELPAACKVVEGNIAAAGWCHVWVQKPA